jgi:hypothetical protein
MVKMWRCLSAKTRLRRVDEQANRDIKILSMTAMVSMEFEMSSIG